MSIRPILRHGNRLALPLLVAFALLCFAAKVSAKEQLTSGTSGRQFKEQAINSIPFNQLNQPTREKLSEVLNKTSIYRRLPVTDIGIDQDYMTFLVRYPEVIVNIWRIMGVTKMTTNRTAPFMLSTDDGVGTISDVELVYGDKNTHIYYGTGSYEGPVLRRKLTGRCVLILRTEYKNDAQGNPRAVNQLDVFLKVDNATAGLVAKTLNPIVGKTADHNFVESLNFLERLNETTQKNGPGVQQMAGRLTDINTDVRQEYIRVVGDVFKRGELGQSIQAARAKQSAQNQQGYATGRPAPQMAPSVLRDRPMPASYRTQTQPVGYSNIQPTPSQPVGANRAYQTQSWSRIPAQTLPPQPSVQATPATYTSPTYGQGHSIIERNEPLNHQGSRYLPAQQPYHHQPTTNARPMTLANDSIEAQSFGQQYVEPDSTAPQAVAAAYSENNENHGFTLGDRPAKTVRSTGRRVFAVQPVHVQPSHNQTAPNHNDRLHFFAANSTDKVIRVESLTDDVPTIRNPRHSETLSDSQPAQIRSGSVSLALSDTPQPARLPPQPRATQSLSDTDNSTPSTPRAGSILKPLIVDKGSEPAQSLPDQESVTEDIEEDQTLAVVAPSAQVPNLPQPASAPLDFQTPKLQPAKATEASVLSNEELADVKSSMGVPAEKESQQVEVQERDPAKEAARIARLFAEVKGGGVSRPTGINNPVTNLRSQDQNARLPDAYLPSLRPEMKLPPQFNPAFRNPNYYRSLR